jgi:hypothetical protein
MTRANRAALAIFLTAGLCAPLALAQGDKPADKKPATPPPSSTPAPGAQPGGKPGDMKMPSPEEMQKMMDAYMNAAKTGPQHEFLKKQAGTWHGKVKSYEVPGQPPQESECDETVTSILGGRFTKCDVAGEMGQMGHFEGLGLYGYDNAKNKFTMAWADNMGTCIMDGTGEISPDHKTLTWTMNYVDPVTKKAGTMKEVDHFISDDETHMEMYGENPMDGKEMKMLEINFKRTGKAPAEKPATPPATDSKPKTDGKK